MEINQAKSRVIQAGKELVERGLIARTWGNVSCRIDDASFVITPSGRDYLSLMPEDIVQVKIEDLSYEGAIKPSSEKGAHGVIYQTHFEANFVIHTHQLNASVVSALDIKGIRFSKRKLLGSGIPLTGYGLPSTKKLTKEIEKVAKSMDGQAMILKNHGALCFGRDYEETFQTAVDLEAVCEGYLEKLKNPSEQGGAETGSIEAELIADKFHHNWNEVFSVLKQQYAHISIEDSQYCRIAASQFKAVRPMVDDFAQIIGMKMPVVKPVLSNINKALNHHYCVLIDGVGAVCIGDNSEDVEARKMIALKTSKAQIYASMKGRIRPINPLESRLMNIIYKMKYSKQK